MCTQLTIQERLDALRKEYQTGQQTLADLEAKRQEVRDTMLRISGAIQVLEEMAALESDVDEEEPAQSPVGVKEA